MIVKTKMELSQLTYIGKIVAEIREKLAQEARVGISTYQLDQIAKEIFEYYHAESAPKKDYQFPGYTCLSLNNVIAHGIPDETPLKKGDILNIDVSGCFEGYYADTGKTIIIGDALMPHYDKWNQLIEASLEGLKVGMRQAITGNRINEIGRAIETVAHTYGFEVIKNLTGHGIGRKLHEKPKEISNYYVESEKTLLQNGQVIAVETFYSIKDQIAYGGNDGWALMGTPHNRTAQFEHTLVVTDNEPLIIT